MRRVTAAPATLPAGFAPTMGVIVHLRRRASLAMVTYLFWEREPPELAIARTACRDIAVPLHIGRTVCDRSHCDHDVARRELGDGLDGFVAIVDPNIRWSGEPAAVMQIAERGVVLATYEIALGPSTPSAPVPLRLFVDAPRMPTDASRSQVRRDGHPIAAAEARAPTLVAELVAELASRLANGQASPRERDAAIALLATEISGPGWSAMTTSVAAFAELANVELVRDAVGTPRKIARSWRHFVYTGRAPVAEHLAPWLGDVLWIPPGDSAARLVAGAQLDARETRHHVRWARRQHRAHRRFLEHAPRPATIARDGVARLRVRLGATPGESCVPAARFAGLSGQLCLYSGGNGGELALLFHGREIERVRIESPIGFEAVVDAPSLVPDDRYRGVVRNAEFARVCFAVRAGAVIACEAIALERTGTALPDGFEAGDRASTPRDDDAVIRRAIELAVELGLPIRAPLANANVWRTLDGGVVSLVDIRGRSVIGVAAPGGRGPMHRLVLTDAPIASLAGREGVRVVRYDAYRSPGSSTARLAAQLAASNRYALVIRGDDAIGAIAPGPDPRSGASRVRLYHVGGELDDRPYEPKLLPSCTIAIDSDAIVPDERWLVALDDGGATTRDFLAWEIELVRAIARHLVADDHAAPSEAKLLGPKVRDLDSELGEMLCHALRGGDAAAILGRELVATLGARLRVRVLGTPAAITIDELAAQFPSRIPFVDRSAAPAEGFAALLADEPAARAIAALAGREAFDGTPELELRRRAQTRLRHLAAHRAKPEQRFEVQASELAIVLEGTGRGFVGVGHGGLAIQVLIEGREFQNVFESGLPLRAVVQVDHHHADATFEALPPVVVDAIAKEVRDAAAPLLAHIATAAPSALADHAPTRALLAAWSSRGRSDVATREVLCAAVGFATLDGTRVSIEGAGEPRGAVSIATWQGEWLSPCDGEPRTSLDDNVIHVPDPELATILDQLYSGSVIDVTSEVEKLQAHRRMARGLIPTPALPHIPRELKRTLRELGPRGAKLGLGEIGLVGSAQSIGVLHVGGEPKRHVALDVMPTIHLAIEAPDSLEVDPEPGHREADPEFDSLGGSLAEQLRALRDLNLARGATRGSVSLSSQAQELAIELVRAIPHDAIPAQIRNGLRRAVLANRLAGELVDDVAMFETLDGSWLGWQAVAEQIARFGTAWAVAARIGDRPLAEGRRVFVLSEDEIAIGHRAFVDAKHELALDGKARRNRERPPATTLALPGRDGVIAEIELDGDGATAARGVIGVLAPAAAVRRGVIPHRGMHPFDVVEDPCAWPTIAAIDDARLEPDRTWERPVTSGDVWRAAATRIRAASELAWETLVEPPDGAIAVERIAASSDAKIQIRGALWLIGAPRRSPAVSVIDRAGTRRFTPAHAIAVGGTLYVHALDSWLRDPTLEALCADAHARLVRQLAGRDDVDPDLIASHVAHALALDRFPPLGFTGLSFGCFRPAPLDAVELHRLLHGRGSHQVVDDGSELSRVVLATLGERARPDRPPLPLASQREPIREHAIQIVVDAVRSRLLDLGVPVSGFAIVEANSPIARFDRDALRFAGDNPRLGAIANAMRASSPWAELAIDALIAHSITVLNVARTEITDATELHVLEALIVG